MKSKWLVIAVVILAVMSAFFFLRENTSLPDVNTPQNMTVNLSEYSNSGQTGTATLTQTQDGVRVELSLTGYDTDSPQPSHIHTGECPRIGPVVHALTDVVNGKSVTNVETTLEELTKADELNINVHASYDDFSTYTSCGNIN